MNTCAKCGMPIEIDTNCSCNNSLCYRCCECPSDCVCGCSNMVMNSESDEEDEDYE